MPPAELSSLPPRRLNLGCGMDYRDGWVNLDRDPAGVMKLDVRHDLLRRPWPLETSSFDHVLLGMVLEHVPHHVPGEGTDGFYLVMEEIHRVLKPGGTALVVVPHYLRGVDALDDPGHTRLVHERSFEFLTNGIETRARFRIREKRVVRRFHLSRYFSTYHVKRYLGFEPPRWMHLLFGRPYELHVTLEATK